MINLVIYILSAVVCYLIGSIPTAYILVNLVSGVDVRTIGSGNVGATNAGRALGQWAFAMVLFLDAFKGFLPVFILLNFVPVSDTIALVGAIAVLIGHMHPIYLKFAGGKGVATGLGVFIALAPMAITITIVVFVIVLAITKMISAGSIISSVALGIAVSLLYDWSGLIVFTWLLAIVVIYKHHSNIKRIIDGTENKFKLRK